jgi:hypothetical protein
MNIFHRLIRLLSSLGLGVILLALIAIILAVATKFEANSSTYLVQAHVYRSAWFDLLLGLFGLNLTLATWNLRPFKFRHAGVIVVHTSLIIILVGAWATRNHGFEGSLVMQESGTEDAITLRELVLRVSDPAQPQSEAMIFDTYLQSSPVREHMNQRFLLPDGSELLADRFYTDAVPAVKVMDGGREENPAVEVSFSSSSNGDGGSVWLHFRDSATSRRTFGDLIHVEALEFADLGAWEAGLRTGSMGTLSVNLGKKSLVLDLDSADSCAMGQGLWLVPKRVYRNFTMSDSGSMQDRSGAPKNPALEFVLTDGQREDSYLFFARMPSFNALRSDEPAFAKLSEIKWEHELSAQDLGEHQVRVGLVGDDFRLAWLDDGQIQDRAIELARAIEMPWNGVRFSVDRFYTWAWRSEDMKNTSNEGNNPAVRLRAQDGDLVDVVWLRAYGRPATIRVNEREWLVQFTQKRVPLGFALHLDDFVEDRYPGSMMASGYASFVTMLDPGDPLDQAKIEISMNHTLSHKGFKFFQSSFQRAKHEGGAETTILSVNHDPGHLIVYFGSLGLVLGLIVVFFFKKRLTLMDRARNEERKAA